LAASKVHGIYADDVKDKSTFAQVAPGLAKYIADSDFAGYNSNKFDIPLLVAEFSRAGIDFQLAGRNFIDVQSIFFQMEQRTLKAAYKFYCDQTLTGAHDAANDIRATYEVFKSQLQRYENVEHEDKDGNLSYPIQNDVEVLSAFTPFNLLDPTNKVIYDESGKEIFNFGKHKGKTLVEVFTIDPGYYTWLINQDFSVFTKRAVTQVWESMKNKKNQAA